MNPEIVTDGVQVEDIKRLEQEILRDHINLTAEHLGHLITAYVGRYGGMPDIYTIKTVDKDGKRMQVFVED